MSKEKSFDEMSKKERVKLLLSDSDKYIEIVPPGHWLLLLDGIAKIGKYEPEDRA